jgi:hypothetical protein
MDVGIALPKVAIAGIIATVVILIVLLAWIGGELHYSSCIAHDELVANSMQAGGGAAGADIPDGSGCSRVPW